MIEHADRGARGRRLRVLAWILLAPFLLWSVAAILLGGGGPDGIGPLRWLVATAYGLVLVAGAVRPGRWRGILLAAVLLGVVLGWFSTIRASSERDWSADQARLPRAEIDGPLVTIHDVRDFRYRSEEDWDARWYDASFDTRELEGVDLFVVHFSSNKAVGHTMLTFRFADDRFVTFSVEVRKERGEQYGVLAGMFKQYELMYVVGDERDLVQLRTNVRRSEVYLHPVAGSREQYAAGFLAICRRMNRLREAPEFYDTLTNNCTTNIVAHWGDVLGRPLPLDARWVLAGGTDEFAYDLGVLDRSVPFEELRRRDRIDEKARACGGRDDFSLCIRP